MMRRWFAPMALAMLIAAFGALTNGRSADAAMTVGAAPSSSCSAHAADATLHHAGLVVTFGDRHSATFCVEFSEDSITGLQLLQRSGLPLVTSAGGQGSAVCGIDGEGSDDPTNCFLPCTGGTCLYWAYYGYVSGAWKFSQIGAGSRVVHDGDIDGWSWGSGGVSSGAIPAPPGTLCPTDTPSPTPALPTSTPVIGPPSATPIVAQPTSTPIVPQPSATPVAPEMTPAPTLTSEPDTASSEDTVTPAADAAEPPPSPSTSPPSDDAAAPPVQNDVAGGEVTPRPTEAAATPAPSASAAATSTPKTGAVIISNEQGNANAAHSEAHSTASGGGRRSFFAFGAVAMVLVAVAGAVVYRRRHVG